MIPNLIKMIKLILPGRTRERIAQEYELEKKLSRGGGDRKSEEANQIRQNGGIDHPKETAEKIAEEHNISPRTVKTLRRSLQIPSCGMQAR